MKCLSLATMVACTAWLWTGCESYEAQSVELASVGDQLAELPVPAELDLVAALQFAALHDPELARLSHLARAAGFDVPGFELMYLLGTRNDMMSLSIDPIGMLRALQRGASFDRAEANRLLLLAEWREAAWRLGTEIAEIYATAAALDAIEPPTIDADERAFEAAGLASKIAAARLRAARLATERELEELRTERERLHARLAQRLGVPRDRLPQLVITEASLALLPQRQEALPSLMERPDLASALMRTAVAEAELAEAYMAQYPTISIGPEWMIGSTLWGTMLEVKLPLDAGGPVRAARARRAAARAALDAAWLAAEAEVRVLEEDLAVAESRTSSAIAAEEAAHLGLQAARAVLEVDGSAFEMYSERATMWIREWTDQRIALINIAVLRARHAARGGIVPGAIATAPDGATHAEESGDE